MAISVLRLVFGDQLNPNHSWFSEKRADVLYVMMEVRQETDYVLHHAQKVIGIFAAMRDFASELKKAGHHVHYIAIDDADNRQSIPKNIDDLLKRHPITRFEYQAPDEWRLDQQLAEYGKGLKIEMEMVDSEHFFTKRDDVRQVFSGRQQWLMEHFYRRMRTRTGILISGNGKPVGGKWNYDHDNRKPWNGKPRLPEDWRTSHNHSRLWKTIESVGVKTFGNPAAEDFRWPLNRDEALADLDAFIEHALRHFGDYQDALSTQSSRLFHSQLSFALNTKMLTPAEVVKRAEEAAKSGDVSLAAAEGFIRQILGWREYVRGVYWAHMPGYGDSNHFNHKLPLPQWFWTGETKMHCLAHSISASLDHAHAHHIQRLMVIGNFALLAGLDPKEVQAWYLGVYIDAFEWVEMPNTHGMSQFADGGLLATKPYVSSAAYIDRMSDYCKGCHYDRKARVGEHACPFNALYWDFFARNEKKLSGNPRLNMMFKQLARMEPDELHELQVRAKELRGKVDDL